MNLNEKALAWTGAIVAPIVLAAWTLAQPPSIDALARQTAAATVEVGLSLGGRSGGHGSGAFVAPHVVLTAAHVCRSLIQTTEDIDKGFVNYFELADGTRLEYGLLDMVFDEHFDKNGTPDLCLIWVPYESKHVLKVAPRVRYGQPAMSMGNPKFFNFVPSLGTIGGVEPPGEITGGRVMRYYFTDFAGPGSSGGPVVDRYGRIVGVLVRQFNDHNGPVLFLLVDLRDIQTFVGWIR